MTVAKYNNQFEILDWQKMERHKGKFGNPLECLRKEQTRRTSQLWQRLDLVGLKQVLIEHNLGKTVWIAVFSGFLSVSSCGLGID